MQAGRATAKPSSARWTDPELLQSLLQQWLNSTQKERLNEPAEVAVVAASADAADDAAADDDAADDAENATLKVQEDTSS